MTTQENKQLIQDIFSDLAKGNTRPLLTSMAEDVRWTIAGTTKWSKTNDGKQAVRTQLPEQAASADKARARAAGISTMATN